MVRDVTGERARLVAAFVLCLGIPAWAWARGDGAFTMYARSEEYRLRIVATSAGGKATLVPPTELARHVGPTASHYFAGADHATRAPNVDALRARLPAVTKLACEGARALGIEAARIDVELWERPLGGEERVTSAQGTCP